MAIDASLVKKLRDACGAGMMDCKMALTEAQGDMDEALKILRKKGMATADKKSARATNAGLIDYYIHPGAQVGVLIEVNCETDFVARNDDFKGFVHDVAIHIAASSPLWVSRDDIPEDVKASEMEIYAAQAKTSGKAGSRARQDRRRQTGQVVRRRRTLGAAVRQGSGQDDRRPAARDHR